jgi:hypothetical protein
MEEMTPADSPIYRDLMRFKPDGWSANAWAVRAGVSRTVWTDMRRHGNPSRRTLERLLAAAGSSLAEFEALRVGDATGLTGSAARSVTDDRSGGWRPPLLPPLPLIAASVAGRWDDAGRGIDLIELRLGDIIGQRPRPPTLANDAGAYAFIIDGQSMWPRFRPQRPVAVSPDATIAVGDDVLVLLAGARSTGHVRAVIGELVARSAQALELRQFNPDATFRLPAGEVSAVHRIAGELI